LIVLDSNFLIGFYNENDAHHQRCRQLMQDFESGRWGTGLMLEYVVSETLTVLTLRKGIDFAKEVSYVLTRTPDVDFVPCSDVYAETLSFFQRQRKTKLSFVDCALATVAIARAEGNLVTFDEEFKKIAGIRLHK
jgi:predicted nucleic acid-binding protein